MPQNYPQNRQNPSRKDESIRRANRIIQSRTFVLMLIMGILMFVLLFFRLFDLQITRHEELQSKAVNQQTRRTVVTASRGTIYDTAGNILAISSSAETIILSPLEINNALNDTENPVTWTKDSLAAGLAEILGKDAASIRKRMDNVKSQYELIQLRADEEVAGGLLTVRNIATVVCLTLIAILFLVSIFIIFALLYWVGMARIVRSQVLTLKESEYVTLPAPWALPAAASSKSTC